MISAVSVGSTPAVEVRSTVRSTVRFANHLAPASSFFDSFQGRPSGDQLLKSGRPRKVFRFTSSDRMQTWVISERVGKPPFEWHGGNDAQLCVWL